MTTGERMNQDCERYVTWTMCIISIHEQNIFVLDEMQSYSSNTLGTVFIILCMYLPISKFQLIFEGILQASYSFYKID